MTALDTSQVEKMKGTAFRSLIRFFESLNESDVLEEQLHQYGINVKQILPSSWYDAHTYLSVCKSTSSEIGYSFERLITEISEFSAYEDLNGVYRFLMKVAGTKILLTKIPRLASTYTNYIKSNVQHFDNGTFILRFEVPESFYALTRYNMEGAVRAVLKINNHKLKGFKETEKEEVFENDKTMAICTYQISYQ